MGTWFGITEALEEQTVAASNAAMENDIISPPPILHLPATIKLPPGLQAPLKFREPPGLERNPISLH